MYMPFCVDAVRGSVQCLFLLTLHSLHAHHISSLNMHHTDIYKFILHLKIFISQFQKFQICGQTYCIFVTNCYMLLLNTSSHIACCHVLWHGLHVIAFLLNINAPCVQNEHCVALRTDTCVSNESSLRRLASGTDVHGFHISPCLSS